MLAWLVLTSCETPDNRDQGKPAPKTPGARVLVVANRQSEDGMAVARYYMERRDVPGSHLVAIDVDPDDEIGDIEFQRHILAPVREAIAVMPERIDFIVLTTGVPIRLNNKHGYSVDAHLAAMRLAIPPMVGLDTTWLNRYHNPYFGATEPFNSDKFDMFLVTRLDCENRADCLALVDRSLAAQASRGPFLLDITTRAPGSEYGVMDDMARRAHNMLTAAGAFSTLDTSPRFVGTSTPLAGYVSWGSNDANFDSAAYASLRFLPGAIAETFVSTSARSFKPVKGGQSRIVDLIAQGVTGVKGYVSEPYTIALSQPDVLFDRYLRGFTLAEAYYASSRMILWKDVVIGDPLCAPYRQLFRPPVVQ